MAYTLFQPANSEYDLWDRQWEEKTALAPSRSVEQYLPLSRHFRPSSRLRLAALPARSSQTAAYAGYSLLTKELLSIEAKPRRNITIKYGYRFFEPA